MIPHGADLWLKTGFGLVAVLFLTSLPTWALGVVLAVGLAAKFAISYLRDQERQVDERVSARDRGDDRG
jgi:hypothetical protein